MSDKVRRAAAAAALRVYLLFGEKEERGEKREWNVLRSWIQHERHVWAARAARAAAAAAAATAAATQRLRRALTRELRVKGKPCTQSSCHAGPGLAGGGKKKRK